MQTLWRANIRDMISRRFFRLIFGACAAVFLAGVGGIILALFPDITREAVVSLHYNIHFGVDEVGPWWRLFVPLGVAFLVTVGNVWYAARVWQREQVIAYAFAIVTLLVHVFVVLHVFFIVLLNLSSISLW